MTTITNSSTTNAATTDDRLFDSTEVAVDTITGTVLGLLRLSIGFIFGWALLDKLFGLGFETCRGEDGAVDVLCSGAVLNGGSATWGFLTFGTKESATGDWFSWLASSGPGAFGIADALYLASLLIVGVTFLTGIALRLGAIVGSGLMVAIYLASSVWPTFNPFMDEHIIYALAMLALAGLGAGRWLGLGTKWANGDLASKSPLLR